MEEKDPDDTSHDADTEVTPEETGWPSREEWLPGVMELMQGVRSLVDMMRVLAEAPPDVSLGGSESEESVRRTIDSLRAGTMRPADPEADPLALADAMEKRAEYRQRLLAMLPEVAALREMAARELRRSQARTTAMMYYLHNLTRRSPSARIAEAEERQRARRQHRARRAGLTGARPRRPGGRKK
jgi:hypothetical protein